MRAATVTGLFLAFTGCATVPVATPVDLWHSPGFAVVRDVPALAPGRYDLPGLTVVVPTEAARPPFDAALLPMRPGDRLLGWYDPARHLIASDGTPANLGHELGHFCQDVGAERCAPAVAAVRALAR